MRYKIKGKRLQWEGKKETEIKREKKEKLEERFERK